METLLQYSTAFKIDPDQTLILYSAALIRRMEPSLADNADILPQPGVLLKYFFLTWVEPKGEQGGVLLSYQGSGRNSSQISLVYVLTIGLNELHITTP